MPSGKNQLRQEKRSSCSSGILAKRIAASLPYMDKKFSKTRQYGETKSEVSDHPILIRSIGPDGRIIRLLNQDSTCRRQDMPTFYRVNGAIYILKVSDINSDTSFNDVPVPYKKTLLISIVWMNLCLQKSSCLPKHKQGLIGILTAGFPAYTRKAI